MTLPKAWIDKINDECKHGDWLWQAAYEESSALWAERAHKLYEALEGYAQSTGYYSEPDNAKEALAEFDKSLELK